MKTVLILAAVLAAALVLCGYTNIRLPVRRREGKTHIACVGDSITYGCTLPLFFLRRYPAVLQRLMGQGVQVAAFGVNDRTATNPSGRKKPFRKAKSTAPTPSSSCSGPTIPRTATGSRRMHSGPSTEN